MTKATTTTTTAIVSAVAGLAGGYALAPAHLPGDANNDGVVNFDDINAVNAHWGARAPEVGPSPFAGARVYTLEGWTVDGIAAGTNEVLIRLKGENEQVIEMLGLPPEAYGPVRRLVQPVGPVGQGDLP